MAIEYLEIRDINREIIGIIDTASSVIWHSVWFGVGDFEIYAKASDANLSLLKVGRYVTRPDGISDDVGIVEKIQITDSIQDGTMIVASGRFAKSILDRRLIYNLSGKTNTPTVLRGNVEAAARRLVQENAISCTFDSNRNFGALELGALAGVSAVIVDSNGKAAEKQVSYANLMEYSDEMLREYGLASVIYIDQENISKKLQYRVLQGTDRSVDNSAGRDPVVFSRDYDNLTASEYSYDSAPEKNAALIGGEGEGKDRFYSLVASGKIGLERREYWVDASSINKTLKASALQEIFPSGVFVGVDFSVGGVVYASLVTDLTKEYTLQNLQEKFPSGVVSGSKFLVGGVAYANRVYGDDEKYLLTALGYKAMLDAEDKEGDYLLSDSVYKSMLDTKGKQDIAPLIPEEIFNGTINVSSGNYRLNRDFWLGDIVTVQENSLQLYINVRITETTEVQDENGYTVEAKYE